MVPLAENWGSYLPYNLLQYADELCLALLLVLFLSAVCSKPSNSSSNASQPLVSDRAGSELWWDNLRHCAHRRLLLPPACVSGNAKIVSQQKLDPTQLPRDATPLLCFVNSKSGGNQGRWVKHQLRRLLNPLQVVDLALCSPAEALKVFKQLPGLRVLACGGDGTVGWVLSEIDKLDPRERPPLAILPLGTGNDLARVLGWGRGYSGESLLRVLHSVQMAHVVMMDRWQLQLMQNGKEQKTVIFNNYFGIGVDAQVALRFHHLREERPEQFWSRMINKCWYLYLGAQEMFRRSFLDFTSNVELKADGKVIPLPPGTQGLIFLNINSYGGGVRLWHDDDCEDDELRPSFEEPPATLDSTQQEDLTPSSASQDKPRRRGSKKKRGKHHADGDGHPILRSTSQQDLAEQYSAYSAYLDQQKWVPSSMFDGLLEVVAVTGSFHLGQLQVGLARANRVCQCREAIVKCKRSMPVQADGEPWGQGKCEMKISATPSRAYMLRQAPQEGAEVLGEVSQVLAWAERTDIISTEQKNTLLLEFSRRLERLDEAKRRSNDFDPDAVEDLTSFLTL